MKPKYSNYKLAKENLINEINKLLKKYPIQKKKIKINKNDMKFINRRKIKIPKDVI